MSNEQILRGEAPPRVALIYNPVVRGIVFQIVVFVSLFAFIVWIVNNTQENLRRIGRTISFEFLNERAGFDIGQSLITYTADSNYWMALGVGLVNTLLIALVGIITATIIGFIIGIGRLSRNWLVRSICTVYVELFRNIPPLLVIFF